MKNYLFEVGQQLADQFYNQKNIKPLNQSKMKTAVEWLVEEMFKQGYFNDKPMTVANINYFANIAKEMEKEHIEDAWQNGIENCGEFNNPTIVSGKQYYNETFKSE
jgi:hypothetical protein